jgi:hypothetical protein
MVTVEVPAVAVALAVKVSTLVAVVGLVPYATVTPLGKPVAAKVTEPVNPPTSVTVTVSVAVLPWASDNVLADGASVKLGVVADPLMLQEVLFNRNEVGIALVTLFQVPLNPRLV